MGIFSDLFGGRRTQAPESVFQVRAEIEHPEPPSLPNTEYAEPEDYEHLPVLTLKQWDYGHGLEDVYAGYGFGTPDGKTWPAGKCQWSMWEDLGILALNVVGESYHIDDLNDPSFDPGRPVRLVPEPDNPVDPKAIAIRNLTEDRTAGYVKKGSTSRLRNLLRGRDFRAMSLYCRYDQPPPRGRRINLKIVVFRPDRLIGAEHIDPHPAVFD